MTERAYAKDLALVRDAYLVRDTTMGTPLLGDPPVMTPGDRRRPSVRSGSDETPQTPYRSASGGDSSLNVSGYFPSLNASSTSIASLSQSALLSHRSSTISGSSSVGKALASADARLIFGNIDHLAVGAEEMALAFESAMGAEDLGPGATPREREGGSDSLGKMFTSLVRAS